MVEGDSRKPLGMVTRRGILRLIDARMKRTLTGPMLSLEAASARLLEHARSVGEETVELADAVGRVLVEPQVVAAVDVPPFANSSMDGFAVRAADAPGILRVAGEVAAGAASLAAVETGTAVRIMTGAPLPPGADAVVPLEDAIEADGRVVIAAGAAGAFVRMLRTTRAPATRSACPAR